MYEDLSAEHLKKSDEDDDNEDSGTWSFSYPSYSRFTFTGKTKSRLGRSHSRLNQPPANRENSTRTNSNNVNHVSTDSYNIGLSSQGPKTPGMSWLQKDKLSSSNTPGSNLFRQSTAVLDSQISNDSGVDVSSQSNFLLSLKNDSVQNSSCKRNLAFNTPFKIGENRQESSLKELNQLLHQNSFPKLKFSFEKSYENKENAITKQNSSQVSFKESVASSVFKDKVKQTSDKDCTPHSSLALDDKTLKVITSDKLLSEPIRQTSAPITVDKKFDDDPSNTPIDLSSGKSLTHENVFSRSFQIEREHNSEQKEDPTKETMGRDEIISKEKSSSDGLSGILPTFLAPANKSKGCEVAATTTFNDIPGVTTSVGKPVSCLPVVHNEIPKPSQQVRLSASSWYSAGIREKNSLKPSISAGELKPTSNYETTVQINSSKESHASNLSKNKEVFIPSTDPNANTAAKTYDQLSAIVNLSSCASDDKLSHVLSQPSKTTTDLHNQPLDSLPQPNEMRLKPNGEFISKNHVVEDWPKTLKVNCKTNEDYKSVLKVTTNSALNVSSCSDSKNGLARGMHHLSKNPTPLTSNPHESILALKKCSQDQLLYDNHTQDSSSKTTESQESFNHKVAKESRISPENRPGSVNQDTFLPSNEPIHCLQQVPGIGQQKTYLAPQQSSYHRVSNDFPHVKPDAQQLINSRLNCHAVKKPQNFKMSVPRGLLTRSNTELYVNGKVYTTLSMLGRGGSSEVYQVLDERSSKLMAVKCVDLSMVDKTIAEGYLNEIDLLSKLQGCSSVIRMFDYEYVQEYKMLYVVMEKGDTDLSQLIRDISKTKKISMSMIIYYWTEMLTAVRDIHERGIIHSDLKPANFLLVSGRLKLIDFGIASSQGDMTSVFKEVTTGTWNYMSPEAIKNTSTSAKGFKITYKSDVWSLGCILYNLLYGKTPFSHITSTWSKLQAIADPNHQVEFPEVGAPLVLAEALRSCLRREPKLRPTVAELLALPYHASGDSRHLAPQLRSILPHEWWTKISHLFQEVNVNEEDINTAGNTS